MQNIIRFFTFARKGITYFFSTLFQQAWIKRYILLLMLSTIVFVFVLFPYNKLVYYMLNKVDIPGIRSLELIGLDISPSGNAFADKLLLYDASKNRYELTGIALDVSVLPLVFSSRLEANIGTKSFIYQDKSREIEGVLSMKTDMRYTRKPLSAQSGTMSTKIKDASLKGMELQGFTIPDISFTTIQAELEYIDNRITIQRFQFGGPDLKGSISGEITVHQERFARSAYNISVTIQSESALLNDYKMLLDSYMNPSSGNLEIQISGTVGNPKYKFIK